MEKEQRTLSEYEVALIAVAQACAAVAVASARLAIAAKDACEIDPTPIIETCRMSLLGALDACPELRDVFVVPARS